MDMDWIFRRSDYALLLEYSTVQEASRLIVRRASRSTVENVEWYRWTGNW